MVNLGGIASNVLGIVTGVVVLSIIAGLTFMILASFEGAGFTIPNEIKNVVNMLSSFVSMGVVILLAVLLIGIITSFMR